MSRDGVNDDFTLPNNNMYYQSDPMMPEGVGGDYPSVNSLPIPVSYSESSNNDQFVYPQDNMQMPDFKQQQQNQGSFGYDQQQTQNSFGTVQNQGSFGNQQQSSSFGYDQPPQFNQPQFVPVNQQPQFMPINQQPQFMPINQQQQQPQFMPVAERPQFMPVNQQQQFMPVNQGFSDGSKMNHQFMTTTTTTTTTNNTNSSNNTSQGTQFQPTQPQYRPTVTQGQTVRTEKPQPWTGILTRIILASGLVCLSICCLLACFGVLALFFIQGFRFISPYAQAFFMLLTLPTMFIGAIVLGTFNVPKIGIGSSVAFIISVSILTLVYLFAYGAAPTIDRVVFPQNITATVGNITPIEYGLVAVSVLDIVHVA
eukprot:gene673-8174_t